MRSLAVSAGLLFLAACAQITVGNDFDKSKIEQIVNGRSSREEVRRILGEPTEASSEGSQERWVYVSRVTSATPRAAWIGLVYQGDTREKKLVILFDGDLVKDVSLSEVDRPFVSRLGFR